MIYLDNASTGKFKPKKSVQAVKWALRHAANPGRSAHADSLALAMQVEKARENILKFYHSEGTVVFTKNCTEALNTAIFGTIRSGHVITSAMEHNSVLRPLFSLKKKIDLTVLLPEKCGAVSPDKVLASVRPNTKAVVLTNMSNVTGGVNDVQKIYAELKKKGILFIVDCAQSSGHLDICFENTADIICAPGHKGLLGPQGTGFLIVRDGIELRPLVFGGTGTFSDSVIQPTTLPEGLESGTLNTAGIIGLSSAIEWLTEKKEKLRQWQEKLTSEVIRGLLTFPEVELYTNMRSKNGVVSFNMRGADSSAMSDFYNTHGIAVRGGLHCAPLLHKHLGTIERGAVRVSPAYPNTIKEIHTFLTVTEDAVMRLRKRGKLYE